MQATIQTLLLLNGIMAVFEMTHIIQSGINNKNQQFLVQQPVDEVQFIQEPVAFKMVMQEIPKWTGKNSRNFELQAHLLPDYTDPQTVLNLARLSLDSYYEPDDKNWLSVPGWNITSRFGGGAAGIRGYLFQDYEINALLIVIKGTSLSTPIGSGPTAKQDKLNDNMMFSCCCAKSSWEWFLNLLISGRQSVHVQ